MRIDPEMKIVDASWRIDGGRHVGIHFHASAAIDRSVKCHHSTNIGMTRAYSHSILEQEERAVTCPSTYLPPVNPFHPYFLVASTTATAHSITIFHPSGLVRIINS